MGLHFVLFTSHTHTNTHAREHNINVGLHLVLISFGKHTQDQSLHEDAQTYTCMCEQQAQACTTLLFSLSLHTPNTSTHETHTNMHTRAHNATADTYLLRLCPSLHMHAKSVHNHTQSRLHTSVTHANADDAQQSETSAIKRASKERMISP